MLTALTPALSPRRGAAAVLRRACGRLEEFTEVHVASDSPDSRNRPWRVYAPFLQSWQEDFSLRNPVVARRVVRVFAGEAYPGTALVGGRKPTPLPPSHALGAHGRGEVCWARFTQGGGSACAALRRALPWARMMLPLWGAGCRALRGCGGVGDSARTRPTGAAPLKNKNGMFRQEALNSFRAPTGAAPL